MKKTSNRLVATGAAILLGACAIALAQHDSRKRDRESPDAGSQASVVAQPISAGGFGDDSVTDNAELGLSGLPSSTGPQIVRGNNGQLTAYGDAGDVNPLRSSGMGGSYGSEQAVVPAGAESAVPSLPTAGPDGFPNPDSLPAAGFPSSDGYASPALPSFSAAPDMGQNGTYGGAPDSLPTPDSLPDMGAAEAGYNDLPASGSLSDFPQPGTGGPGGLSDPANGPPNDYAAGLASGPPSTLQADPLPNQPPGIDSYPGNGPAIATPPVGAGGGGYAAEQPTYNDSQTNSGAGPSYGASNAPRVDSSNSFAGTSPQTGGNAGAAFSDREYSDGGYEQRGALPATNLAAPTPASPAAYASQPNVGASSVNTQTGMGGPSRTAGSLASLVSDVPGNRYLDGPQSPSVTIEIRPPGEEIQVGKKAAFVIMVSNRGNVDALDVTVVDRIPRGTQFAGAEPQPTTTASDLLVWELGRVPAGEDRVIRMNIIPEVEGEVGSTASLLFASQASARALATQPKLELVVEASSDVLIGNRQNLTLVIRNSGSGIARNVKLTVDVPENLSHSSGASIEAMLPDLHPNESRRIDNLVFSAIQPGLADCMVRVLTDDGVQAEERVPIDVRSPKLVAQIQGPKERYLQREATYTVAVANTGTATATQLEFAVHLPAGLAYVGCDKPQATYDRARHVVYLKLAELPASAKAPFQINLLPVELGSQSISVKTTGDLGIVADASTQVTVNGRAELEFTIGQDNGQIEVGATTTYEVRILNKGDKPDRNVALSIELPQGSSVVDVSPKGAVQNGNVIQFQPIEEMPIRDSRTYRFVVQHTQSGTQVVRSRLISENLTRGVLKEVPTFVYADD